MPDPSEILTLRTFLKGFTCNLTLSHFQGGPVKKTTLYELGNESQVDGPVELSASDVEGCHPPW